MVYLITTLHVVICFFLIIVVLLQSGKAADLAGAFGGMGSQTVFGPARHSYDSLESHDYSGDPVYADLARPGDPSQ